MKSMYPIQIMFFVQFPRGTVLSTMGTPPAQMQKNYFISIIPKKPPKPYEIHVPKFRFDLFWGVKGGNLLSTLGAPPAQMQKTNHRQNPENNLQNPMKSMYPIQIYFSLGPFGGNLLRTLGIPPCKNTKKHIS